jgi:hypothetical protein
VDPQPSQWASQHKFISRDQQEQESVNEFSVALKKMTINCEFNCSCGKSVADLLLKLQFIRTWSFIIIVCNVIYYFENKKMS